MSLIICTGSVIHLLCHPKNKKWYLAASTKDGIKAEMICLGGQKSIEIEERTIVVLVAK